MHIQKKHGIFQLMNQITEAFSQKKYTLGKFINHSKLFDIDNHNISPENLKAYEIQSKKPKIV